MWHVLQFPHHLSSTLLESLLFVSLSHSRLTQPDTGPVYIAAEAHGLSMLNLLFTRTLKFFCAELLLASLSTACSAAWAWTFHLSLFKSTRFPSVHSFSFAEHLPDSSPALQYINCSPTWHHPQTQRGCIPSLQQTCHTVSVPASILWCTLGYCI